MLKNTQDLPTPLAVPAVAVVVTIRTQRRVPRGAVPLALAASLMSCNAPAPERSVSAGPLGSTSDHSTVSVSAGEDDPPLATSDASSGAGDAAAGGTGGDADGGDTSTEAGSSSSSGSGAAECPTDLSNTTCQDPAPYTGPGVCNPYAPQCPAGQKCAPWSLDGSTRCIPLDREPVQDGDVCEVYSNSAGDYIDNCAQGLFCHNGLHEPDDPGSGVCIAQCTCSSADPVCPAGSVCLPDDPAQPGIALCFDVQACDPLLDDCLGHQACYPLARLDDYAFFCFAVGELPAGSPCPDGSNCDEDSVCSDGICRRVCDLEEPRACDVDQECGEYLLPLGQRLQPADSCVARVGVCK